MVKVQTGYMPFGKYQTYYRIVGEATTKAPLVLIHGGPGSTHNYFEVLDELAETNMTRLAVVNHPVLIIMRRKFIGPKYGWRS